MAFANAHGELRLSLHGSQRVTFKVEDEMEVRSRSRSRSRLTVKVKFEVEVKVTR